MVFALRQSALGVMVITFAAFLAKDGSADELIPIVITMRGPGALRVRVAQGPGRPCDSSENHMLVDGKYDEGTVLHTSTTDACVCVQQTYEPFNDVDWSLPISACRPVICSRRGRHTVCVPAPDPTIRIEIRQGY